MKLLAYFFTGIIFLSTTQIASALDLDIGGGYWDVEDLDAAWGVTGRLSEPIVDTWVDATLGAGWFYGEEGLADDSFQLVPIDLGVKVHLTSGCEVDPYLLAGGTYLAVDNDDDALPDLDGNWGAYTGAGLEYPIDDKWGIYSDLIFRYVDLDAESAADVDANGLQATAGVSYTF